MHKSQSAAPSKCLEILGSLIETVLGLCNSDAVKIFDRKTIWCNYMHTRSWNLIQKDGNSVPITATIFCVALPHITS